jgi:hypothetical protein
MFQRKLLKGAAGVPRDRSLALFHPRSQDEVQGFHHLGDCSADLSHEKN